MSEIVVTAEGMRNASQGIGLLINNNFFYYDGKYSPAVHTLTSQILRIEAMNRGVSDTELRAQLPTFRWQLAQLKQLAALPQKERGAIGDYAGNSSNEINNDLVANPDQVPLLNLVIDELPPLDRDIVVWRYIRKYEVGRTLKSSLYLPPDSGEYEYYSYLSTSFLSYHVINETACQGREVQALMRIMVPKGSKCLYIPSVSGRIEYEILFPHRTRLRINGKEQQSFVCREGDNRKFIVYDCSVV